MNPNSKTYRSPFDVIANIFRYILLALLLICFSHNSMSYFIETESETTELLDLELEDDLEVDAEDELDDLFNSDLNQLTLAVHSAESRLAFAYGFGTDQYETSPSTPPPDFT